MTDSKDADRIFAERINSKYREHVVSKIEKFYRGEIEEISETFEFHRSANEIIWLHLNNFIAEKRNSVTNKPIKIIGYHQDITAQKEIETKLNHSAKLESIGLMASGIAHEINNPLAIISGLNQKIKKSIEKLNDSEVMKDEIAKDLIKVDSTIQRISKNIQGIKNFSRDSSSESFEFIYFQNLIDDIITFTEYRMKQTSIRFTFEGDTLSLKIYCQPIAISQVLINLINNSIDAIENLEEKWIQLKIDKNDKSIILKIMDSGKGVDLNIQEKIMSPFFTTKEIGKGIGIGIGLGLGICLSIISNHNGNFFLEKNAVNITFIIELPIKETLNSVTSKAS